VGEDEESCDGSVRRGAQRPRAPVSAGEVRGAPAVHLVARGKANKAEEGRSPRAAVRTRPTATSPNPPRINQRFASNGFRSFASAATLEGARARRRCRSRRPPRLRQAKRRRASRAPDRTLAGRIRCSEERDSRGSRAASSAAAYKRSRRSYKCQAGGGCRRHPRTWALPTSRTPHSPQRGKRAGCCRARHRRNDFAKSLNLLSGKTPSEVDPSSEHISHSSIARRVLARRDQGHGPRPAGRTAQAPRSSCRTTTWARPATVPPEEPLAVRGTRGQRSFLGEGPQLPQGAPNPCQRP